MITQFQPDHTYLDRYILDGYKNKFSTFLFMSYETIGKFHNDSLIDVETWRLPTGSIFTDYNYIVGPQSGLTTTLDLTNDQVTANKYRYNPKKLSYDLYSTVELWTGLLEINSVKSVTEFNFDVITVFTKYRIMKELETLLIMTKKIKEDII